MPSQILSPIFGSQVPGLPQNHDVVKAQCHKRYKNFRRANNMTQFVARNMQTEINIPVLSSSFNTMYVMYRLLQ